MPFPRASQALSRFTVLDLTRVRSGPTCVRQLADWGANVIKVDALLEDTAGEQPGGPRHGSDFQNLHRNKRAMTLNLKDPRGLDVFMRLAKKAEATAEKIKAEAGVEATATDETLPIKGSLILSVTENGYGKRTPADEYRLQGRGGSGVINVKTTERNGKVVGIAQVTEVSEVMLISQYGKIIRMDSSTIRESGRAAQGVRLLSLEAGDRVAAAVVLAPVAEDSANGGLIQ